MFGPMMMLLEGQFRKDPDGTVWVDAPPDRNGNLMTVTASLQALIGHHVQFAMSHLPSLPLDSTRRGLGSCNWGDAPCPFGHTVDMFDIYTVTAQGTLEHDPTQTNPWSIVSFDGTTTEIRLDWMVGHNGRIACASITELEKLRESVATMANQVAGFSIGTKQ
jgi:hypothetical protein